MHVTLIPFSPCPWTGTLSAGIEMADDQIRCSWTLEGLTDDIDWPAPAGRPERTMGLWEQTCFEFFLGPIDAPHYYEFNLSPDGNWNTFSFSDLRQSMQETPDLICEASHFVRQNTTARLEAQLQFTGQGDAFRLGICAILQGKADKNASAGHASAGHASAGHASAGRAFFAVAHPGQRPDFHRRDGHTLRVERLAR